MAKVLLKNIWTTYSALRFGRGGALHIVIFGGLAIVVEVFAFPASLVGLASHGSSIRKDSGFGSCPMG